MSFYEDRKKRTQWFMEDRFGMFIHWGLYAIPARVSGEWFRSRDEISNEEYQQYFEEFNPVRYDPKKWAKMAKEAGIKYAVMTTKHHDGFCLFDSAYTEYKATNTPASRDLIREYVDAFRAEGIKVGFYYSLIDWYHPDYPHYGDATHPMRNNEAFKDVEHNFDNYVTYMHNQVKELLTNYGKIDIMWFDFSYHEMTGEKWEATKLINMIRSIQPDIIIDNRLGGDPLAANPPVYSGDFYSPEQIVPSEPVKDELGREVPWESCITLNNHWGYGYLDREFMTPQNIIHMLVDAVSKNGNLLINIGPNAKGAFPKENIPMLKAIGEWMEEHGDSIYGCGQADLPQPPWGRYTQKGKMLYAHIFERGCAQFLLEGLDGKLKKARLLEDGAELKIWKEFRKDYPDDAFIEIGKTLMFNELDTVLELELL